MFSFVVFSVYSFLCSVLPLFSSVALCYSFFSSVRYKIDLPSREGGRGGKRRVSCSHQSHRAVVGNSGQSSQFHIGCVLRCVPVPSHCMRVERASERPLTCDTGATHIRCETGPRVSACVSPLQTHHMQCPAEARMYPGIDCEVFEHPAPMTLALSVLVIIEMLNALNRYYSPHTTLCPTRFTPTLSNVCIVSRRRSEV